MEHPFFRVVTNFHSYVDELGSVDGLDNHAAPPLVCFTELPAGGEDHVLVSMIAITPSTGDVVWDEFEGEFGHI